MTTEPVLAFDIGGTNLRGAIVDAEGRVVADARVPSLALSPEEVARAAGALARELEHRAGVVVKRAGAGVAAMLPEPGDVVENAPNLGWRNAPLKRLLREALDGRPVDLFNDLDAIAYGEAAFGAARGSRHVLCVFVGTGVGAGIIIDNRLLRGHRGVAAEFGHVRVVPNGGRACGCGAFGCLEAYVGGAQLLERIQAAIAAGKAARVAELAGGGTAHVSHVDRAASEGDPWASALWEETETFLSVALANLVTVLNPETLVLGGGVLARAPHLWSRVKASVPRYTNAVALTGFSIVDAGLGDDAGLVGAAALSRAIV